MFNMGFQGNFGGGFIGNPGSAPAPAAGAGVTYAMSVNKPQPRDRSGRRSPYVMTSTYPEAGLHHHRRSS